jgi:hypothetical protein
MAQGFFTKSSKRVEIALHSPHLWAFFTDYSFKVTYGVSVFVDKAPMTRREIAALPFWKF